MLSEYLIMNQQETVKNQSNKILVWEATTERNLQVLLPANGQGESTIHLCPKIMHLNYWSFKSSSG